MSTVWTKKKVPQTWMKPLTPIESKRLKGKQNGKTFSSHRKQKISGGVERSPGERKVPQAEQNNR